MWIHNAKGQNNGLRLERTIRTVTIFTQIALLRCIYLLFKTLNVCNAVFTITQSNTSDACQQNSIQLNGNTLHEVYWRYLNLSPVTQWLPSILTLNIYSLKQRTLFTQLNTTVPVNKFLLFTTNGYMILHFTRKPSSS